MAMAIMSNHMVKIQNVLVFYLCVNKMSTAFDLNIFTTDYSIIFGFWILFTTINYFYFRQFFGVFACKKK